MSKLAVLLKKSGVFIDGRKAARPIQVACILRHELTQDEFAEVEFQTWDRRRKVELFPMSAFNSFNRRRIVDRLADKGYRWPTDGRITNAVIAKLAAATPEQVSTLVDTFGWHGQTFIAGSYQFPERFSAGLRIDSSKMGHRAPYLLGPGNFEKWKASVGRMSKRSASLRMVICAAFAAPLLKPLSMPSFGINMFGPTSQGKSSLLYGASSVAGLIDDGLPTWADTAAATEQFFVGYNDNILPLDETGDAGRDTNISEKARLLSFGISRNRVRSRDAGYERKIGLETRNFRTIVLSTSERALIDIARDSERERIPGETLRLIDLPVVNAEQWGVFNSVPRRISSLDRAAAGKIMADRLRADAIANQGHALHAFLAKLTSDADAIEKVQADISFFNERTGPGNAGALRVRSYFSLLFAAGALAIRYKIVPWSRTALFRDIARCWDDASRTVAVSQPHSTRAAAHAVADAIKDLKAPRINRQDRDPKASPYSKKVIFFEGHFYIRKKHLPAAIKEHLPWLVAKGILIEEGRTDVLTTQKTLPGVPGRKRYYVISRKRLANAQKSKGL